MPCTPVERWLQSGQAALIGSYSLRPVEHKLAKGKPLSSQKGQAEAFFLVDASGSWWILKKFRQGCILDNFYLEKVASVLPKDPGFACGTGRDILATGVLRKAKGYHHSRGLDRWLDGTILMPRVKGVDWAGLADEIRDGEVVLEQPLRLTLCRNLTRLVELLEAHGCAHRDLSCGNVFVVTGTGEVCLIDFDSLFHPSVAMPNASICWRQGCVVIVICPHPRVACTVCGNRFPLRQQKLEELTAEGKAILCRTCLKTKHEGRTGVHVQPAARTESSLKPWHFIRRILHGHSI